MTEVFADNFTSVLAAPCSGSDTLITPLSEDGAPTGGEFRVVIDSEVLLVTDGLGTGTWTVTRGEEGTAATDHTQGTRISHLVTAGMLTSLQATTADPRLDTAIADIATLDSTTLKIANDLDDVADQATARDNLGLGTSATHDTGTGATNTVLGNDSRLSDARTPTSHAASHKSAGGDSIKLDELAAPTDITTLDASTSHHGLLPKLDGNSAHFLDGTGAYSTPPAGGASLGSATPIVDGTGAAGTAVDASHEDHVHPTDTSRAPASGIAESAVTNLVSDLAAKAPLASPVLTGDPHTPDQADSDNDQSIANTKFVQRAIALLGLGTASTHAATDFDAAGAATAALATAESYTDTHVASEASARSTADALLAPLASPVFTGDPHVPDAGDSDNDSTIANTKFVQRAIALLGLGTASTHASGDFAPSSGIAESAITNLVSDLALKAPIASPTFTGTTTAPEFSVSGLTGATAASRYVGATASGAPTSGTFAVGDYVVDQRGMIWVCNGAGTPGTWICIGAERAITLGISGIVPATVTDGADFIVAVPFDMTLLRIKATCKVAPTGAMVPQLRLSTNATSPSWADVSGFAVTFVSGQSSAVANPTDVTVSEGNLLGLSVGTGSGTNLLVEAIGVCR